MIQLNNNDRVAFQYHSNSICNILSNRINDVVKQGGIYVGKKGQKRKLLTYSANFKRFLDFIKKPPILKTIINADPEYLKRLISLYNLNWQKSFVTTINDSKILYNIFVKYTYERKLDKLKFIRGLGNIDTCIYCNRSYIYSLYSSKKKKSIKPELDHFYPKNDYPFLAVSFYNLIPSCQACNGINGKHKKDPFKEGLVNPYLLKIDDFIFSYKINNISIINPLSGKSSIDVFLKKTIRAHSDIFNLDELYSLHHDHVLELIIKRKVKYNEKYRTYLKNYKSLKFSDVEIDRLVLGNYTKEKEIHKRPLAKLYQDIGRELGLIK